MQDLRQITRSDVHDVSQPDGAKSDPADLLIFARCCRHNGPTQDVGSATRNACSRLPQQRIASFIRSSCALFKKACASKVLVEGANVAMNYRWAEGHFDELDVRPLSWSAQLGCFDRCNWWHALSPGSEKRNHYNPDRIRAGIRSRPTWTGGELQQTRRQRDRDNDNHYRAGDETSEPAVRSCSRHKGRRHSCKSGIDERGVSRYKVL